MIEKIVAYLKFYKTQLQFLHWNSDTYSEHILFDRLIDEIDGLIDRAVEVFLSEKVVIDYDTFKHYSKEINEMSVNLQDIKDITTYIKDQFNDKLTDTQENVVVDIKEMLEKHIYLLRMV